MKCQEIFIKIIIKKSHTMSMRKYWRWEGTPLAQHQYFWQQKQKNPKIEIKIKTNI